MIGILMDIKNKGTVVPFSPDGITKKLIDILAVFCYTIIVKRKRWWNRNNTLEIGNVTSKLKHNNELKSLKNLLTNF